MNMNARVKQRPVRLERERLGLTRERLAVQAGVSTSTVYLAERAGLLSRPIAEKLAAVLGVSPEDLLR